MLGDDGARIDTERRGLGDDTADEGLGARHIEAGAHGGGLEHAAQAEQRGVHGGKVHSACGARASSAGTACAAPLVQKRMVARAKKAGVMSGARARSRMASAPSPSARMRLSFANRSTRNPG